MQIFVAGLGGGVLGFKDNAGNLYTAWKVSLNPNAAWSSIVSLGNPGNPLNAVFAVSVGNLPDGRMQVFVSGNGAIYTIYKLTTSLNSAWSNWTSLGSPGSELAFFGPSVGYLPDGRMQIFAMGNDRNLYSIYKLTTNPNSAWSGWTNLGNIGSAVGNTIAVGRLEDSRMQIFITGFDDTTHNLGSIYTKYKLTTDPNSAWSNWTSLGSPGGSYSGDVSVGYLPDGRMQIFICASDGTVHTAYKLTTVPTSDWSGWTSLGNIGTGIGSVYFAGVTVGNLPDGRMQIFVMGYDENVYTKWKLATDPSSGWSGWANLGNPGTGFPPDYTSGIAVGYLPDDRMQIFIMGNDGKLYTKYKMTTDPSSAWSEWLGLGSAGPAYSIAQITYGVAVGYLVS
jgi:acylphosphatase